MSACKHVEPTKPNDPKTYDEGVVINGVKWATRNVDAVGTFAPTPESAGKFYQWNRKIAWNTTDETVTGWDNTNEAGESWAAANNPSPAGWRVPTLAEIQSLGNTTYVSSVWTTQNGINGRLFTDLQNGNTLFLPAAGWRYNSDGTLGTIGSSGGYWSSSTYSGTGGAYGLIFDSDIAFAGYVSINKANGYSVRCVAE